MDSDRQHDYCLEGCSFSEIRELTDDQGMPVLEVKDMKRHFTFKGWEVSYQTIATAKFTEKLKIKEFVEEYITYIVDPGFPWIKGVLLKRNSILHVSTYSD